MVELIPVFCFMIFRKGEYCQHMECLNNCSYPNGICNPSTGQCACSNIQNPFNTSNVWSQWQGEDCSYLPSWCSNSYSIAINQLLFITILYSIAITFSDWLSWLQKSDSIPALKKYCMIFFWWNTLNFNNI